MVGGAYGARCARPAPSRARARPSTPRALERARCRAAGLCGSKRAPGVLLSFAGGVCLPWPRGRCGGTWRVVRLQAPGSPDGAPRRWRRGLRFPFRERDRRARPEAYARSVASVDPLSSAWRSAALFWCARIAAASGSNSGTNRFRLSASLPGETVSPWAKIHAETRCTGRKQAQCSNRKRAQKLVP